MNIKAKPEDAPSLISARLQENLEAGRKVIWFVSGGSSLPIAAEALKMLPRQWWQNLFIILVDDVFSIDSTQTNAAKFSALIELPKTLFEPIFHPDIDCNVDAENFARLVEARLRWADVSIGQFGLGEGFHTGGIQPMTVAAQTLDSYTVAYEYEGKQRITVTPGLIKKLDYIFINSFGIAKRHLVQHFLVSKASIYDEPTQALKQTGSYVLVSDQL